MSTSTCQSAERNIEEIKTLVDFFCKRVANSTPAYISLEFRNGTLKFTMNNSPSAPYSRQPSGGRPTRQLTTVPNWTIPPPCITPGTTSTETTEMPLIPQDVHPAAEVLTAPTAPTTRASTKAKKRKATGTPPTSTPEIARAGRHQENFHASHLVTPVRDVDAESCSSSDVVVEESQEDEGNTQIMCDFFTKNKFSVLDIQTTPRPAANNASADTIETDASTLTHRTI